MGIFRKKPVKIEAFQFTGEGDNNYALPAWCGGKLVEGSILIPTLEGTMKASLGDWIIKGVQGEFYPCKPDIFDKTYEKE